MTFAILQAAHRLFCLHSVLHSNKKSQKFSSESLKQQINQDIMT